MAIVLHLLHLPFADAYLLRYNADIVLRHINDKQFHWFMLYTIYIFDNRLRH